MNHLLIDEQNIVELYVIGRLPQHLREEFEEHYVGCDRCLRLIEENEQFRGALRRAVIFGGFEPSAGIKQALVSIWQSIGWGKKLAAAVAVLAIASALMLLSYNVFNLRRQPQAPRIAAEDKSAAAEAASTAERQAMLEQRRQLESQIERERAERLSVSRELQKLLEPQANTPIFVLSTVRSGGPTDAGRGQRLVLPKDSRMIVLSPELDVELPYKVYRASLLDPQQQIAWQSGGLRPSTYNSFAISFASSFFRPGRYELRLEGIRSDGTAELVNSYLFQVVKK